MIPNNLLFMCIILLEFALALPRVNNDCATPRDFKEVGRLSVNSTIFSLVLINLSCDYGSYFGLRSICFYTLL